MRVKHKERGYEGNAVRYNPHSVSPAEMIIIFDGGDMDSDYVMDWDPADPKLTHEDLQEYLQSREP